MKLSSQEYGISESKIALLNTLAQKVNKEQHNVEKKKVVVSSLSEKMQLTRSFLEAAEAGRTRAYANLNLVNELTQEIKNLEKSADEVYHEMETTTTKSLAFAHELKNTTGKLICAAELLNKMANLIIRKKALNPLISDELINLTGQAGNNANNAVASMLAAMKTAVTAISGHQSSLTAATSVKAQIKSLQLTAGKNKNDMSLQQLYQQAYNNANLACEQTAIAAGKATLELNAASIKLNKAQTGLTSFQAAFTAAAQAVQLNQQA
ncbi:hypothetical protein [Sediminibacterium ginsengisoli]|nr:hypothetical protein [Sediminibacterium ginsengisoli]